MSYKRPVNPRPLPKKEKRSLLREYFKDYEHLAAAYPSALNRKIKRKVFSELHKKIGGLLQAESKRLAKEDREVHEFLRKNPLPKSIETLLSKEFRVFCLILNGLKQWVSAEQHYYDRYLLGGNARAMCRVAAKKCLVTRKSLIEKDIVLHHPVRDGRPPVPLSRAGHARIEKQESVKPSDRIERILCRIKVKGNHSWARLRRGCLLLEGRADYVGGSLNSADNARTFARNAAKETGLQYSEILDWLHDMDK